MRQLATSEQSGCLKWRVSRKGIVGGGAEEKEEDVRLSCEGRGDAVVTGVSNWFCGVCSKQRKCRLASRPYVF